jgi:4,5-dihydroxyphthalate decarboxylase
MEQYGVDNSKITWVVDDDDHVEGHAPDNVERVTDGRSLSALLRAGEIDAAFTGNAGTGRAGAPRAGWTAVTDSGGEAYPLFADAEVLSRDWYLRTGIYPLHSVIALKAELVDRDPALPTALYRALAEAKRRQVARDPEWSAQPHLARQAQLIGGDPVPYGMDANVESLRALERFGREQGLLDEQPAIELFAAGDYALA